MNLPSYSALSNILVNKDEERAYTLLCKKLEITLTKNTDESAGIACDDYNEGIFLEFKSLGGAECPRLYLFSVQRANRLARDLKITQHKYGVLLDSGNGEGPFLGKMDALCHFAFDTSADAVKKFRELALHYDGVSRFGKAIAGKTVAKLAPKVLGNHVSIMRNIAGKQVRIRFQRYLDKADVKLGKLSDGTKVPFDCIVLMDGKHKRASSTIFNV